MLFKIQNATAKLVNRAGTIDRWQIYICVEFLDIENQGSKKHNKIMSKVSKFMMHLMKNEIGINCTMSSVGPAVYSYKNSDDKHSWFGKFDVFSADNNDEQIGYMIWWLSSCKGREFEI